MANRVVVIEVHEYPGHRKPGVRVGTTPAYNPATKDQNLIGTWAGFVSDTNEIAGVFADINTAVDAVDVASP